MTTRMALLLALALTLASACGQSRIERPLEGAPVRRDAQTTSDGRTDGPPPTLAPAVSSVPPAAVAASPVGAPLPSPEASPIPGYVIVATDGAGANLRTAPSTRASVIITLREGTPVAVVGEPVSAEGRSWQQIRSGDHQGWVVAVVVRPR